MNISLDGISSNMRV